jgi:hypothetical protein
MLILKKSNPQHSATQAEPTRRQFLKYSGVAVAIVGSGSLLFGGCKDDDDSSPSDKVNLGSGDVGVLNYAYALEQLEAAFYAQVIAGGYWANASADEKQILADIEKHERAHREFFKAAIATVGTPIADLEVDFSSINFSDRSSVLGTAKTFEDLGVSAYNGAGKLLTNADYLLAAGKIVSVEARHAAAIRSIFDSSPKSFAGDDVVDNNGLDAAKTPTQVLNAAKSFLKTSLDASGLPG